MARDRAWEALAGEYTLGQPPAGQGPTAIHKADVAPNPNIPSQPIVRTWCLAKAVPWSVMLTRRCASVSSASHLPRRVDDELGGHVVYAPVRHHVTVYYY